MDSIKFGQLACSKEELGRGAYGTVYKGAFQGIAVAIKKLLVDRLSTDAIRGIYAMECLDHPNVLKVVHVKDFSLHRLFAMELCAGTLEHYAKETYRGPMPEDFDGLLQMARGVEHIHVNNLIHKEIKPSNVLVHLSADQVAVLKISDFGLCKMTAQSTTFTNSAIKGTHNYLAPELLAHLADSANRLFPDEGPQLDSTAAADIFALGCVFYFYLTRGSHPFGTGLLIATSILTGYANLNGLNSDYFARPIIGRMIHGKADVRPSISQVIQMLQQSDCSTDL